MCKKILHLPGRRNPQDIQDTMKAALVLVEQNQYTSISFPALGTGEMERVNLMLRDQMYDYLIVCSTIISSPVPVIITTSNNILSHSCFIPSSWNFAYFFLLPH